MSDKPHKHNDTSDTRKTAACVLPACYETCGIVALNKNQGDKTSFNNFLSVGKRLHLVELLMRDNYEAIGFLPMSRIHEQERRGLIWHQYDNGEWLGYCVVGAMKAAGTTHIWQECIDKTARGYGSGSRLFAKLLAECKRNFVHQIQLRCAENLESNLFWQAMGFEVVKIIEAKNRRKRKIIVYRLVVTPSLFEARAEKIIETSINR